LNTPNRRGKGAASPCSGVRDVIPDKKAY